MTKQDNWCSKYVNMSGESSTGDVRKETPSLDVLFVSSVTPTHPGQQTTNTLKILATIFTMTANVSRNSALEMALDILLCVAQQLEALMWLPVRRSAWYTMIAS